MRYTTVVPGGKTVETEFDLPGLEDYALLHDCDFLTFALVDSQGKTTLIEILPLLRQIADSS